jgi:hypothetical protein
MRAIMTAVDYADILAITLPYNRHHFTEVMVVTSPGRLDADTRKVAEQNDCRVCCTDLFHGGGSTFNKFAALERGLNVFGRHGRLCVMDADILFPKHIPDYPHRLDTLYTPKRRMFVDVSQPIPQEPYWASYPYPVEDEEFAGYTQIFDAGTLLKWMDAPWYASNHTAGDSDSLFQSQWSDARKQRPPFEVLHLGPACVNWCGRVSQYTDGSVHPEAPGRQKALKRERPGIEEWQQRYNNR